MNLTLTELPTVITAGSRSIKILNTFDLKIHKEKDKMEIMKSSSECWKDKSIVKKLTKYIKNLNQKRKYVKENESLK